MINNWLKTIILLASLTALMLGIGNYLGGKDGVLLTLIIAAITNFLAYWYSSSIILSWYAAEPLEIDKQPALHNMVKLLAQKANIPLPKLYIIYSNIPNAFATGRNPENSAIAVTLGALRLLSSNELYAVIAHELSHIKHHDTLIAAIAATVAGTISMLARWVQWIIFLGRTEENSKRSWNTNILVILISPLVAMIVQFAIARSREFAADREGARLCGEPKWLINALIKLEHVATTQVFHLAEKNPATAHLFIISPLQTSSIINLFSTHPPVSERINKLRMLITEKNINT